MYTPHPAYDAYSASMAMGMGVSANVGATESSQNVRSDALSAATASSLDAYAKQRQAAAAMRNEGGEALAVFSRLFLIGGSDGSPSGGGGSLLSRRRAAAQSTALMVDVTNDVDDGYRPSHALTRLIRRSYAPHAPEVSDGKTNQPTSSIADSRSFNLLTHLFACPEVETLVSVLLGGPAADPLTAAGVGLHNHPNHRSAALSSSSSSFFLSASRTRARAARVRRYVAWTAHDTAARCLVVALLFAVCFFPALAFTALVGGFTVRWAFFALGSGAAAPLQRWLGVLWWPFGARSRREAHLAMRSELIGEGGAHRFAQNRRRGFGGGGGRRRRISVLGGLAALFYGSSPSAQTAEELLTAPSSTSTSSFLRQRQRADRRASEMDESLGRHSLQQRGAVASERRGRGGRRQGGGAFAQLATLISSVSLLSLLKAWAGATLRIEEGLLSAIAAATSALPRRVRVTAGAARMLCSVPNVIAASSAGAGSSSFAIDVVSSLRNAYTFTATIEAADLASASDSEDDEEGAEGRMGDDSYGDDDADVDVLLDGSDGSAHTAAARRRRHVGLRARAQWLQQQTRHYTSYGSAFPPLSLPSHLHQTLLGAAANSDPSFCAAYLASIAGAQYGNGYGGGGYMYPSAYGGGGYLPPRVTNSYSHMYGLQQHPSGSYAHRNLIAAPLSDPFNPYGYAPPPPAHAAAYAAPQLVTAAANGAAAPVSSSFLGPMPDPADRYPRRAYANEAGYGREAYQRSGTMMHSHLYSQVPPAATLSGSVPPALPYSPLAHAAGSTVAAGAYPLSHQAAGRAASPLGGQLLMSLHHPHHAIHTYNHYNQTASSLAASAVASKRFGPSSAGAAAVSEAVPLRTAALLSPPGALGGGGGAPTATNAAIFDLSQSCESYRLHTALGLLQRPLSSSLGVKAEQHSAGMSLGRRSRGGVSVPLPILAKILTVGIVKAQQQADRLSRGQGSDPANASGASASSVSLLRRLRRFAVEGRCAPLWALSVAGLALLLLAVYVLLWRLALSFGAFVFIVGVAFLVPRSPFALAAKVAIRLFLTAEEL